jgi:8-oxo-dGTP diphosphatase
MPELQNKIKDKFGYHLRTRVSGICIREEKILMVKHVGLGKTGTFWAPPGGGMIFGTTAKENLIREVKEETGLNVSVGPFLFVNEYLENPLHAIELFFRIEIKDGKIQRGFDPELSSEDQIIEEVRFMSFEEIEAMRGPQLHNIFNVSKHVSEVQFLKGYFILSKKH